MSKQFLDLNFDNRFGRLSDHFYTKVKPTPFKSPHYLVSFNYAAAALIDLDENFILDQDFIDTISGKKHFEKSDPLAMLYSGHQFGGDDRLGSVGDHQPREPCFVASRPCRGRPH